MKDPQRFFNRKQRREIFDRARGLCEQCQNSLVDGWHAHHKIRHNDFGLTRVENGMALCLRCHQTIEGVYSMTNRIRFRSFQSEFIQKAVDNFHQGKKKLVGIPFCGSGKTLAALATGNEFYRKGWIDCYVHLTPRVNLCRQIENDWTDKWEPLLASPKMGKITHRTNERPILHPSHFGYVTTYQSVVQDIEGHESIFQDKNVLFVLDEAQRLGVGDDMVTAQVVEHLMGQSVSVIIMTATDMRSDYKKLLWCNYNKKDDLEYLDYDVKSSYRDGVSQGFLRYFDFAAIGGEIIKEHFDFFTPDETIPLKDYEGSISAIVSRPEIYKPVVDKTISMLKQAQANWPNYKALVAALDQKHAKILYDYVKDNHQDVKAIMAISDQGQNAKDNLETFKSDNWDLLISVEMAYIGFDCPEITVIGYLTSRRFQGFLEQLSGRGLRVIMSQLDNSNIPSFESQYLFGVMPADKKMIKFAEQLRTDALEGFKKRKKGPNGGPHDPLSWIKQVNTNGFEGKGYWTDGDIDQEELEILNDLAQQEKVNIPLTFMASTIRRAGGNVRNLFSGHKKQADPPKTKTYTDGDLAKNRRKQIQGKEIQAAKQYRKRFRMSENKNDITQSIQNVTAYVNKKYRLSTISEASTELLATMLDYVSKQLMQDINNGKVRAPYN